MLSLNVLNFSFFFILISFFFIIIIIKEFEQKNRFAGLMDEEGDSDQ